MRAPPSSWKQGHQLRPRMSGLRERRDGRVGRLIDKRERCAFPGPPEVWTLNLKAVQSVRRYVSLSPVLTPVLLGEGRGLRAGWGVEGMGRRGVPKMDHRVFAGLGGSEAMRRVRGSGNGPGGRVVGVRLLWALSGAARHCYA